MDCHEPLLDQGRGRPYLRKVNRTVPPLKALHVFEVVCRLGNFTHAASELGVTQSAVSRQISLLEHWLSVELFRRERLGVRLTEAGEEYARTVAPAFAAIVEASSSIRESGSQRPLSLRVYPTFALRWLIPQLPSFNKEYPDIDVQVGTEIAPIDFSQGEIDLAIQLIADDKRPANARPLFPDLIQPVCSAAFLERHGPLETPDDFAGQRLLVSRYRRNDWGDWLSSMGHGDIDARGMEFQSSLLTYQAATEGLGIAMGQTHLLQQDFESGSLVPLFAPVSRPMAYYVLWAPRTEPNRKSRAFLAWLERAARPPSCSGIATCHELNACLAPERELVAPQITSSGPG